MEVKQDKVKPETMQILVRFNARLFINIQEERKQPAPQLPIKDTVPREEFESLKTLLYDFKA
jgi:hypothetical protein